MRNIINHSSIANVSRFSVQATVMLRGGITTPVLNLRHANDCAGAKNDELGRDSYGLSWLEALGKPEPGTRLTRSEPMQRPFQPAFCLFQRIS